MEESGRNSLSLPPPGLIATDTTPPSSPSVSRTSIATNSTAASSTSIDRLASSLSASNHNTKDTTTMKEDAEVASFRRFFDAILSTDAHERTSAEAELALRHPYSKASFLYAAYRRADKDDHRTFALSTLCTHVDVHWTAIFPRHQNDEKRDQFCHKLLGAVESEENSSFRTTLAYLVAVVAGHRLEDSGGVQDWAELMEYMKLACGVQDWAEMTEYRRPESGTDVHMRVALAIVMVTAHVFGDQAETCRAFFHSFIWSALRGKSHPEPEIIKALVAVYSSTKCTEETRRLLEPELPMLARIMQMYDEKKRIFNDSARNELTEMFLRLCTDTSNVNTKMLGLTVVSSMVSHTMDPRVLDRGCLALLKSLIEFCLSHSHPAARPTALATYAQVIMQGDNEQSQLRDLFPSILTMCYEDPLVDAERPMEDIGEKRFTPLDCLKQMATKPMLLLQPHLQAIALLCRDLISSPDQSDLTERAVCATILHSLLSNYWTRISSTYGRGFMSDLCEFAINHTSDRALFREMMGLILLFTKHNETNKHAIGFLNTVLPDMITTCASDSAPHEYKAASMSILHQLAESSPNLLKHILAPLVALCCKICDIANNPLQEPASLILHRLCERTDKLVQTNAGDQIPSILEWALREAVAKDRDPEDEDDDDDDDEEDGGGPGLLNHTIKRISSSLTVPALTRIARAYSNHGDPLKRYMCILAWGYVVRRCKPTSIATVTDTLVSYLSDTDAPVRSIACRSLQRIAKLSTKYIEKIQIHSVLTALLPLFKDTSLPLLANQAGWTMSAFIDVMKDSVCNPMLTAIVGECATLLGQWMMWLAAGRDSPLVQSTLWPIHAICTKDPAAVGTHYDRLITPLMSMLRERLPEELLTTVVNGIGQIGAAAGAGKFTTDGIEVLGMISADISPFLSFEFLAGHLTTIFDVIGGECTRFLPVLVPQIIKVYKEYAGAETWELFHLSLEKDAASIVIDCLAKHTGDAFTPYAAEVKAARESARKI